MVSGTGSNLCYMEEVKNIEKLKQGHGTAKKDKEQEEVKKQI